MEYRRRSSRARAKCRKVNLPTIADSAETIGRRRTSFHSEVDDDDSVENQKYLGVGGQSRERLKMETPMGFHNDGVMWDALMARWAGAEDDWIQKLMYPLQKLRRDSCPYGDDTTESAQSE